MRIYVTLLATMICLFKVGNISAQLEGKIINEIILSKSLEEVLTDWRRQFKVTFAFDSQLLRTDTANVTFDNLPMDTALRELLLPFDLEYKIVGKVVLILPVEPEELLAEPIYRNFSWSGRVVDKDSGESLPFATLRISGTDQGITADESGNFKFGEIPADTCIVIVSYVGYEDFRFRLTPGNAVDEKLIELKLYRGLLPQAVIYGEYSGLIKQEKVAGLQSISCSDLSMLGSASGPDVMKMARLLPGIDATDESGNGLTIRGSDPDQSLVQMDGFTIYHLDHFFGVFSAFNPSTIKSLRVHKGVLAASEGGRAGGKVELVARDGNNKKLSAVADLGILTASLMLEGPIGSKKKCTYMIGFRRALTDLYQEPIFKSLFNNLYNTSIADLSTGRVDAFATNRDPSFTFYDFTAKLTLYPSEADKVQLSFYNGLDDFNIHSRDTTGNGRFVGRSNDQISWGNTGASIRWLRNGNKKITWENTVGFSHYQSKSFSADSLLDILSSIDAKGSRFENNILDDLTWHGKYFLNLQSHHPYIGIAASMVSVDHERNSRTTERDEQEMEKQDALVLSFFAGDKWNLLDKTEIDAGLRFTGYTNLDRIYAEPRLNLSHSTRNGWTIKFGAGRSVQFIHRVQVQSLFFSEADYWRLSDDSILPVLVAHQLNGGFNRKIFGVTLDVELFIKNNSGTFENLAPYFSLSAGNDTLLLEKGKGQALGADVLLQKDFRRHHFWLGYSILKSWNKLDSFDEIKIPESFEQRHQLKFVYQLKLNSWDLSLAFFYGSGKPYTPLLGTYTLPLINGETQVLPVYGQFNSARLPDYHRVDVSASYMFHIGKFENRISLSVFNVYNKVNIRDREYFAVTSAENYLVGSNDIRFLGFTPSIFITVKW